MSPSQQASKTSFKTTWSNFTCANFLSFILAMTIVICVYNITMHFIAKWDGHFQDTKGCTMLQSSGGKLFKVDSCNGDIEPISIPMEDIQKNVIPPLNPPLPYGVKPPSTQQPLPPKKPAAPPQNPEAPKVKPYMI